MEYWSSRLSLPSTLLVYEEEENNKKDKDIKILFFDFDILPGRSYCTVLIIIYRIYDFNDVMIYFLHHVTTNAHKKTKTAREDYYRILSKNTAATHHKKYQKKKIKKMNE